MKNKFQHLFFILLLFSCQPDEIENTEQAEELNPENIEENVEVDEFFTATIDGEEFSAVNDEHINAQFDYYPVMQIWQVSIAGGDNEGNFIEIYILNYNGPGTYSTGMNGNDSYMMYVDGVTDIYWWSGETLDPQPGELPDEGILEITKEEDGVLEGTFKFTGFTRSSEPQKKEVTEGTFRINASRE